MKRFYVDGRGGCIAVRDRLKDNEEDQGLHADMDGVLAYWTGSSYKDDQGLLIWRVEDWQREKAEDLCSSLLCGLI
tara:strand:+ start:53 stop:280 length:228 start_codon:yes stop_codon:yes gene_type:complete